MPHDRDTSEPAGDWIVCPHCGKSYNPICLDMVLYHANAPHRPIRATGLVGEKMEPTEERSIHDANPILCSLPLKLRQCGEAASLPLTDGDRALRLR